MPRTSKVLVRVPPVEQLDTETFIRHLEARHAGDLAMEFKPLPGQEGKPRVMLTRIAHETYHDLLHRRAEESGDLLDHHHDYPLYSKSARPTGVPGMIIRDKQTKELYRWNGHAWKLQTTLVQA